MKLTDEEKAWCLQVYDAPIIKISAVYEAGLRAGIERAAKICEDERLHEPQTYPDEAYNLAVTYCAAAIRALLK